MRHILLKKALAAGNFAPYPAFSIALFFIFFVAVILWIFRPGARIKYKQISTSVLED